MGSPFPPAMSSSPSLPGCLLAPPSMPSLGNCFPCVTVDLGKYVLYSSALSWRVPLRTSLAMSFGGAGVLSLLMDDVADNNNSYDFQPKEKKPQTQHYIYARRDMEDSPLEIISPQVSLWYRFYVHNFYIYKDEKLQKAFQLRFRLPYKQFIAR
jgi:hypothetical protein